MLKFILSIDEKVHAELEMLAKERGISIQELLRAVISPEWIRFEAEVERKKAAS